MGEEVPKHSEDLNTSSEAAVWQNLSIAGFSHVSRGGQLPGQTAPMPAAELSPYFFTVLIPVQYSSAAVKACSEICSRSGMLSQRTTGGLFRWGCKERGLARVPRYKLGQSASTCNHCIEEGDWAGAAFETLQG